MGDVVEVAGWGQQPRVVRKPTHEADGKRLILVLDPALVTELGLLPAAALGRLGYMGAKNGGWVWYSIKRLAEELGTSPQTMWRVVRQLQASGHLAAERPGGRGTVSRFHVCDLGTRTF